VAAIKQIKIPATLQSSLIARLDRLGPAKDIALIAATIGREFSFDLLAKSCDVENDALLSALDKLVEADIVRPRGTEREPSWEFKHALLRDAAYQLMVRPQRKDTHARIADALERNFPARVSERPAIVAQHWGLGGRPEKAAPYFQAAAEMAGARSANVEAVAYLNEGLRMVAEISAGEERDKLELPMQLLLAGALRGSKGFAAPETGEAYLRSNRLCETVGTPGQKVAALNGLYSFHLVRSEVDLAGEIADSLLAYVEQDPETTNLMIARRSVACQRLMLGRIDEAIDHFQSSLALYDLKTHGRLAFLYGTDHKQTSASFCSHALWLSGKPEQAEAMQRESLRHAEALNHGPSIAQALTFLSFLRVMARDLEGTVEPATRQLLISRRVSFTLMEASARFWLAAARRGKSSPDEILEEMRAATRLWWSTSASQYRGYVLTLMAETCLDAERVDEGLALVAEAEGLLASTNERWAEAELHRVKAMLVWRQGASRSGVEDIFRRGIAVARGQRALAWELRCAVSLAHWLSEHGRRDEGVAEVDSIYRGFNEGFESADLLEARALLGAARLAS
jgi:tetratricopeptide (TPR) repeat protein